MSLASAEHPVSRRLASAGRAGWSLSQPKVFSPHPVPANDQSDPRNELDELDDRIGAKYDSIAALMHERNARPEDKDVAARLQGEFEKLRVLQHERAERMSAYFQSKSPMDSDEDSDVIRKAKDILKKYENTPSDNASGKGSLLAKS